MAVALGTMGVGGCAASMWPRQTPHSHAEPLCPPVAGGGPGYPRGQNVPQRGSQAVSAGIRGRASVPLTEASAEGSRLKAQGYQGEGDRGIMLCTHIVYLVAMCTMGTMGT
jgi:hypothetical protein